MFDLEYVRGVVQCCGAERLKSRRTAEGKLQVYLPAEESAASAEGEEVICEVADLRMAVALADAPGLLLQALDELERLRAGMGANSSGRK